MLIFLHFQYLQCIYHAYGSLLILYEKKFKKATKAKSFFDKYSSTIIFPVSIVCLRI